MSRRCRLIADGAESMTKRDSQRLYCFAKIRRNITVAVITVKGAAKV
jgi:hypothetical protein